MVRKLLKHEFIALGRILLPAAIVVLALAVLSSLSMLSPSSGNMETIQIWLMMSFIIGVSVITILAYITCIKRFYDSVFSRQGYMTLALPVSPAQLLFAKTFAAVVAVLFSFVVIVVAGELYGLIHGVDIFGTILESLIAVQADAGIIAYTLFVGLIGMISALLFMYACMAAGQLFNKHRKAASVVIWLVAGEILSLAQNIITRNVTSFYATLTVFLIQSLIIGAASVFFIRYILKNKVNLLA